MTCNDVKKKKRKKRCGCKRKRKIRYWQESSAIVPIIRSEKSETWYLQKRRAKERWLLTLAERIRFNAVTLFLHRGLTSIVTRFFSLARDN